MGLREVEQARKELNSDLEEMVVLRYLLEGLREEQRVKNNKRIGDQL